jgi:hypothetical protein
MKFETNWQIWPAEPAPPRQHATTPHPRRGNEETKTWPNTITNQNVDEEAATGEDESGDLPIRGFWTAGANCILDVRACEVLLQTDPVQSKCWSRRKKRRKENSSEHAWRIAGTSHLLEAQTFAKRLAQQSRKVAVGQFESSWMRESKAECVSSPCHTFVPARKHGACAQCQHPILAMGRPIVHAPFARLPLTDKKDRKSIFKSQAKPDDVTKCVRISLGKLFPDAIR